MLGDKKGARECEFDVKRLKSESFTYSKLSFQASLMDCRCQWFSQVVPHLNPSIFGGSAIIKGSYTELTDKICWLIGLIKPKNITLYFLTFNYNLCWVDRSENALHVNASRQS